MISFPTYGIADRRFVITVAPQNDIYPHGRTYPINAVAMFNYKITTPMDHVIHSIGYVQYVSKYKRTL